jgi:hypothetical protein
MDFLSRPRKSYRLREGTDYESFPQTSAIRASEVRTATCFTAPRKAGTKQMKYLLAWALGVPGIVIVIWFLMSHH